MRRALGIKREVAEHSGSAGTQKEGHYLQLQGCRLGHDPKPQPQGKNMQYLHLVIPEQVFGK